MRHPDILLPSSSESIPQGKRPKGATACSFFEATQPGISSRLSELLYTLSAANSPQGTTGQPEMAGSQPRCGPCAGGMLEEWEGGLGASSTECRVWGEAPTLGGFSGWGGGPAAYRNTTSNSNHNMRRGNQYVEGFSINCHASDREGLFFLCA